MKRTPMPPPDPAKAAAWRRRSRRVKPMSDQRRDDLPRRREVREAVFERDRCCVLLTLVAGHCCLGPLTPHHVRKAGQGGPYAEANLVAVCAFGNSWLETQRPLARSLGLER